MCPKRIESVRVLSFANRMLVYSNTSLLGYRDAVKNTQQNKSTKRGEVAWVHAPWRPNTANTAERVAPPPRAPSQVRGESVWLIMHGM